MTVKMTEARRAEARNCCEETEYLWRARLSLGENGDMHEAMRANGRLNAARLQAWRYLPDALDDIDALLAVVKALSDFFATTEMTETLGRAGVLEVPVEALGRLHAALGEEGK